MAVKTFFTQVLVRPFNLGKKCNSIIPILCRYISIDNDTVRTGLLNIMSALSTMQQPTYFRMAEYVDKSKHLLPLFRNINLTDFMLTTLPTCNELFGRCKWHGEIISCCEAFSLQRTEEGFCYSFNSLTSEAGKHWYGQRANELSYYIFKR